MTSRTPPGRTPRADTPDPAPMAEAPHAPDVAASINGADAGEAADPPVQLTRRERRAAARGGPAQKIAGPATGRPVAPPARHRDYAARKHG
jgi:hypothetical protein